VNPEGRPRDFIPRLKILPLAEKSSVLERERESAREAKVTQSRGAASDYQPAQQFLPAKIRLTRSSFWPVYYISKEGVEQSDRDIRPRADARNLLSFQGSGTSRAVPSHPRKGGGKWASAAAIDQLGKIKSD
jgi:hypothetical protein